MVDIIILLIVLVIIIFAVKGTIKHFKGEGACCGGGSKGLIKTEEKKLQHPKIGEKTVKISGMHCEHCAENVTRSINRIDGAAAKVSFKKSQAIVSYDRQITTADTRTPEKKAGSEVEEILYFFIRGDLSRCMGTRPRWRNCRMFLKVLCFLGLGWFLMDFDLSPMVNFQKIRNIWKWETGSGGCDMIREN